MNNTDIKLYLINLTGLLVIHIDTIQSYLQIGVASGSIIYTILRISQIIKQNNENDK
jgi:hypothetical protein